MDSARIPIEVDAALDLLANGSVILDDEGDAWQKFFDGWKVTGGLTEFERPTLPAQLLYSPILAEPYARG